LVKNKKNPVVTLGSSDNMESVQPAALSLAFNRSHNDLIAGAFQNCTVKIYQLGSQLIIPQREEIGVLNELLEEKSK
jgi:hypothetical protein